MMRAAQGDAFCYGSPMQQAALPRTMQTPWLLPCPGNAGAMLLVVAGSGTVRMPCTQPPLATQMLLLLTLLLA